MYLTLSILQILIRFKLSKRIEKKKKKNWKEGYVIIDEKENYLLSNQLKIELNRKI